MNTHLNRLPASYELSLVALSVIIAICAAYTIVSLTERVAKTEGLTRVGWLLEGSFSLGVGIWSMHFVGMLAFHLSIPIHYNSTLVLLSILPAIGASGLVLWLTSRKTLPGSILLGASLLMGLGIAAMHYLGMAAMRLSAEAHYNSALVILSVSVAVGISFVALWLTHQVQKRAEVVVWWQKVGAAILMGLAIPVMHYTGIAAVSFTPLDTFPATVSTVQSSWLTSLISAATFAILGVNLLAASEAKVIERTQSLTETLEQLQQSQVQLIQTEKMSGLGQLVAGIAHEVNNPINFIHGNIKHINGYTQDLLTLVNAYQTHYPNPPAEIQCISDDIEIDFLSEDSQKLIKSMKMGTERIRQLVLSLRNFSRLDEASFKLTDIHEGIDNTLLILQHRLKGTSTIEVIKNYGQIPLVEGYPGQLNQVFMNLLANAMDALDEAAAHNSKENQPVQSGKIWISTHQKNDDWVQIAIADNGLGMPDSIVTSIFDPFFTTKPIGKGTGLGLSISYQIVTQKHGGRLSVDAETGGGTKFMIEIPIQQPEQPTG